MPMLRVSGPQLAKEFVFANTLSGREFSNALPAAAVDNLIALPTAQGVTPATWVRGAFTPVAPITARFDWLNVLQALLQIAQTLNVHTRFHPTQRKIDMGAFGASSGVILVNPQTVGPAGSYAGVGYIESIKITEETQDCITTLIPLGQGEGANAWTIKYATRTSPYLVQTGVDGAGLPYYYLRDAAAAAVLGRDIVKAVAYKDVGPIANNPLAWELASNALYDLGATDLQRHAAGQTSLEVQASNLEGARFEVGDLLQVAYQGFVEDSVTSRRAWKTINAPYVCLEKRRTYNRSGLPAWGLQLSDVARWRQTDEEVLIGAIETLQAFKTAIKPYAFLHKSGPVRESIDASRHLRLDVEIAANVRGLLQSTLRVWLRPLKSNVRTVEDGGGDTSSAGGGHSHSINAGSSSGGGSSHSHPISGFVEGPSDPFGSQSDQNVHTGDHLQGDPSDRPSSSARDLETGDDFITSPGRHAHGVNHHFHQLSGDSPAAANPVHVHKMGNDIQESSETGHTHDISGRSTTTNTGHDHTIDPHNHALDYGIFEDSLPNTPAIQVWIDNVDRTGALGGPWNVATLPPLDISAYMQDAQGRPLWGTRRVEIRRGAVVDQPEALDVILEVESMLIATALMPD